MTTVVYGEPCEIDKDCKSNVCELEIDSVGNPLGRKCIHEEAKYGRKCNKILNAFINIRIG